LGLRESKVKRRILSELEEFIVEGELDSVEFRGRVEEGRI